MCSVGSSRWMHADTSGVSACIQKTLPPHPPNTHMFCEFTVGCPWVSEMTPCRGGWISVHSLTQVPELGIAQIGAVYFKGWHRGGITSCPWDALPLCTLKEVLCLPGFLSNCSDKDTGSSLSLVSCLPQRSVSWNCFPKSCAPSHGAEEHSSVSLPTALFSCRPLFIFPLHSASWTPAPKHFPLDSLPVEVRRRSAHSVNVYTINFALSILEDNSPCF